MTIAERLARTASEITFEEIPPDAVAMAKMVILDQLGVQLRGSTLPNVAPAFRLVEAMHAAGEATVIASSTRTVAPYAAYVNATFGNSCQYDDAHALAWHPGSSVLPVALAFAERDGRSGQDVIAALVVGTQVMAMLGAVTTAHMQRVGWHGAKVLGVFGAAAAAGRMLDLSPEELTQALAVAGSDSSGTMEYDVSGGEVKRLHAGAAARCGAQAALLAADGLTGPPTIFEGAKGIFRLFGDSHDGSDLIGDWDHFHIVDAIFRMYPAVGTVHSPLDAIRLLRAEHGFTYTDVARIRVGMTEYAVSHGGTIVRPSDVISAQYSLAFSIGLLLVRGTTEPQYYFDSRLWSDPEIMAVADRVEPYVTSFDSTTPHLSAHVDVRLHDGRHLSRLQPSFRGHPANPASVADLEVKFRENAAGVLSDAAADSVITMVAAMDRIDDITELTAVLGPSARPAQPQ